MIMMIERNTNYAYQLKNMDNPTFDKVRDMSTKFYRELPKALQDELYETLNRGVDILDSEPQMTAYIFAFGKMHQAKLKYAFNKLPEDFLELPEINIIDYGCGQALGTMCYADFLLENGYSQKVKTITLIEPSEICMKRAALHTSVFFPEAEIKTINKKFDDLTQDDIICGKETPTLHILSNVLDMTSFDLGKFSGLIKSCLKGSNQFVCVGPYFKYSDRDDKLKVFCNLLDGNAIYAKVFDKFQFDSERTWTAQVYCFSKNSDECSKKRLDERLHENFVELLRIPSIEAEEVDLKEAVKDEYGILYSRGGELLLECSNKTIETYTIKAGTKVICDCAFEDCLVLKQITIPNSVTKIGFSAFCCCVSLRQIIIPKSVTIIGNGAFNCCSSLKKIIIPNSITHIRPKTFERCQSLQEVVIPNTVTSIGNSAFGYCDSLREIRITNSVSKIGNAFYWSLKKIIIPEGATAKFMKLLDDDLWEKIFEASNNETETLIHPHEEIEKHVTEVSEDAIKKGVKDPLIYTWTPIIYSKSWKRLLKCKNTYLETYTIKKGTRIICNNAFEGIRQLQTLYVPDSVTTIGDNAFYGCESLQRINLPDAIIMIGRNAFLGCKSLQQISIPLGSTDKFKKMLDKELWDKLVEKQNRINQSILE